MKYCPYCGAELIRGSASFCSECGKSLEKSTKKKPFIKRRTKKERKPEKNLPEIPIEEPNVENEQEPVHEESIKEDYDGYYDDVVPFMEDTERQALDKELIKKISIIVGGVLTIIILCVILLYKL